MIAKWQIMEPGEEVRTGRILRRDLAFAVVVEVYLAVLGCFSNPTREDTLSALGVGLFGSPKRFKASSLGGYD